MDTNQEFLKPLLDNISGLSIKVSMESREDGYYIHFDGTKTYSDITDWQKYWNGFNLLVKMALHKSNFKCDSLTQLYPGYIVAFIGTLFDFLAKD